MELQTELPSGVFSGVLAALAGGAGVCDGRVTSTWSMEREVTEYVGVFPTPERAARFVEAVQSSSAVTVMGPPVQSEGLLRDDGTAARVQNLEIDD